MFAKVFNTARRILSRSPSVQDRASESEATAPRSHDIDSDMVTSTRRGPVEDRTPQSSVRKGKRSLEVEDTSTVSRKRRKSPAREEGGTGTPRHINGESNSGANINDTILAAQPARVDPEVKTPTQAEKLPIRHRRSPMVVIEKRVSQLVRNENPSADKVQEAVGSSTQDSFHTPGAPPTSSIYATPATPRNEVEGSPTPHAVPPVTNRNPPSNRPKGKDRKKEMSSQDELSSTTQEKLRAPANLTSPVAPTPKNAHIRFGSEEPEETPDLVTNAAQALGTLQDAKAEDEEEDESDSDEAPEEVTAASAFAQAKAAEAEAVRAFQAQQERVKLKKREHAERVAKEQEQKRKKEEKKSQRLVKREARKQNELPSEPLGVDVRNLPALLPDSILEAAGDRRPPTPPRLLPGLNAAEKRQEKLNRHIKFLERGEKPIKDVKRGSLNVRVLTQENVLLAPKVNRDTKDIRERWLKGRQVEKKDKKGRRKLGYKKVERRPVGGGFLRGEG